MSFVFPNFLWALFFVLIPIIIHLFYFRRYKKIYFSNTSLLSEVKDERSSKNKLKHLLVLLMRILTIICLVLAFSQPFFSKHDNAKSGLKRISIYVDNSFSMEAEGEGLLLFDEAKEIANNIIDSYTENDKFHILTNDFEGKHQRFVNKLEAKSFIDDIEISSSLRKNKTVFERQKSIFKSAESENIIYQISDFQKNNGLFINDTSFNVNLVKPKSAEQRNIYIDSVWFDNSYQLVNSTNHMLVRFRNENKESVNGNYQLILNDQAKSIGDYQIEKNGTFIDTVIFKISKTGWNTGKIQISDYPIIYDDIYYYTFYVEEKVNVLTINDDNDDIFKAVFQEIENINYLSINYKKLDYNNLFKQHLIILDRIETIPTGLIQSIKKYVENGGSVFVVPNKKASLESYNVLLSSLNIGTFYGKKNTSRNITSLNLKHFVLSEIFEKTPKNIKLPKIESYYNLKTNLNSFEEQIMSFSNRESYLSSFHYKNGTSFVVCSSIEKLFSNLISNELFAPMLYRMAILGVNNSNLSYEINSNTNVYLKNTNTNFEDIFKVKNNEIEIVPQKSIFNGLLNLTIHNKGLKAGIYEVFSNEKSFSKVALNYNRKESILKYYSKKELKDNFSEKNITIITGNKTNIQENLLSNNKGHSLWKWFIVFSLIFIAFEILILRFIK